MPQVFSTLLRGRIAARPCGSTWAWEQLAVLVDTLIADAEAASAEGWLVWVW